LTRAVVITGGPGTGKSSVALALTTLLENAGIEHGAIESEQLAWGSPWLPDAQAHEQLAAICRLQRGYGRRLFVVVATTETQADLDSLLAAIGADRSLVACLRAPGDVAAARVLAREPERWAGREALAAHARELATAIPALPGVDVVLDTDGREPEDVAAELLERQRRWARSG
jgi:chloramphenicol 3-O-phosphotransferase